MDNDATRRSSVPGSARSRSGFSVHYAICSASNPFDLGEQVDLFLASGGATRLDHRLVVTFVGGNDVRADLEAGGTGAVITCAVAAIVSEIQRLAAAGADRFLVANVPDIGATPAIRAHGRKSLLVNVAVMR